MSASNRSSQTKHPSKNAAVRSSLLFTLLLPLACGNGADGNPNGNGGTTAAGGHANGGLTSAGGTTASGGLTSAGGAPASGGAPGSGGLGGASSGGRQSAGGAAAAGGTSAGAAAGGALGGGASSGGASAGNSSSGGASKGGASSTSGGRAGAPSGGSSSAGMTASGGAGGTQGNGSPGCGSTSPLKSGNFTETIDGATRKYVLDVPTNYDTNKKYRLIFVWHPLGGSASQVVNSGYNGLKSLSNGSAIFVAADGLNGSNSETSGVGWWNVNNVDIKFATAMLDRLQSNLCVDKDRIFSTGFSFGGMMSYTVGFEFDVFRAVAPCSGDLQVIPHKETNTAPLPIMAFHGNSDSVVNISRGRAARDKYISRNGCTTQTQAVEPSPCVQYQGCKAPTIWCEFSGDHVQWSKESQAIWTFFSQF